MSNSSSSNDEGLSTSSTVAGAHDRSLITMNVKPCQQETSSTINCAQQAQMILNVGNDSVIPFQKNGFHVERQTMDMPGHGAALPLGGVENSTYNLPTSNLPPEFRLESSCRLPVPQLHQDPRGSTDIRGTWSNRHPGNQRTMNESSSTMRSQEPHFQDLLSESIGPRGFYPPRAISFPFQHYDTPVHQVANWPSQFQSSTSPTNLGAANSRSHNTTVYDPMYDTIGLPVDPHLRVFVTRRGHGTP